MQTSHPSDAPFAVEGVITRDLRGPCPPTAGIDIQASHMTPCDGQARLVFRLDGDPALVRLGMDALLGLRFPGVEDAEPHQALNGLLYRRADGYEFPIAGEAVLVETSVSGSIHLHHFIGGQANAAYLPGDMARAIEGATAILKGSPPPRDLARPSTPPARTRSERASGLAPSS